MLEKYIKDDELFFHKAGLVIGGLAGIFLGFVVSDRADRYEIEEIGEEVLPNGPEEG
jgi:hypothetical protein